MNSILNITENILGDNSIDEYNPVVGTNLKVDILGLTSKHKIFLHIPVKAFYL